VSAPEFHVLIHRGDALAEVDRVLAELKREHGAEVETGFHKYLFVTKAESTVVMVSSADSLLARALRGRRGWQEPGARGG
jgi:RNase P/RNase MRP subunit p30